MSFTAPGGTTYRIADAHAHIYKNKIAAKASDAIGRFYDTEMSASDATSETLLQRGACVGVERFLVCSAATTVEQVGIINDFIADECANHPEFIGLGTAHPDVQDMEALLDRIEELGLRGIKLHPDFQRFNIDDERMIPLYEGATKRGLVMLFHVGDERHDWSAPEHLAAAFEKVPDMKCHAAHFGCCRVWKRRPIVVESLVKAGADIMFDTSSMLAWSGVDDARKLIEHLGVDHLMWGTDFPMWDHAKEMRRFLDVGLTPEENKAVLYDNFTRFYQLED